MKSAIVISIHGLRTSGETVEKVPKRILGWDAEKNDLTECVTINDLIIARGHETPENHPLTMLEGFSTVSIEIWYEELNTRLEDYRKEESGMWGG